MDAKNPSTNRSSYPYFSSPTPTPPSLRVVLGKESPDLFGKRKSVFGVRGVDAKVLASV